MRLFLDVEQDRGNRRLPNAVAERTVHRSSLLVPELAGYRTTISFLNHFLIKRGIAKVACRVTAVNEDGKRLGAKTVTVDEPRVYFIELGPLFPDSQPNSYVVEFYSAENLAIPFPAVMINHFGNGTVNMVHAYNRVLNEVFDHDGEVAVAPAESAIDVQIDDDVDTFAVFAAGPQGFKGSVDFELSSSTRTRRQSVPLDLPRLTQRAVGLKEIMPDLCRGDTGILRISTRSQFLFFGRMLAGQRKTSGAFSANHTYYDSSTTAPEFFKNDKPSWVYHPFIPDVSNTIRLYPFFSRSRLRFTLILQDRQGAEAHRVVMGEVTAPGADFLTFNVNDAIAEAGIDGDSIAAVRMEATPVGGNTPTRIPHQLVHGAGGLEASVVCGFNNDNMVPPMRGFVWGQLFAGGGMRSHLGIARSAAADRDESLLLQVFDETGKVAEKHLTIAPGSGRSLQLGDLVSDPSAYESEEAAPLWYLITGSKPTFSAHSVVVDRYGNCTAEHAF